MTPRRLALLAALAACLGSAPARAAAPDRETVEASERELRAGLAAYEAADYAVAIEHFERAYALHASPQYLYAWAQAARSAGDCAAAVDLYERFIASGATGASLTAAQQNQARCREQLAAAAPAQAQPDEPATPEPEPEPLPIEPATPTEPTPARRRPDGLGLALVITGGAAVGAGSALLALAGARRSTQAEATDYDRFDALDQQVLRLDVAGGATLGVGAALAIAGVVRLTVKSRRDRTTARKSDRGRPLAPALASRRTRAGRSPTALVTPSLDARGTPLLLLRIALP